MGGGGGGVGGGWFFFFFFNDPAPPEIYTLSLPDALPISGGGGGGKIEKLISVSGRLFGTWE